VEAELLFGPTKSGKTDWRSMKYNAIIMEENSIIFFTIQIYQAIILLTIEKYE